MSTRSNIIVKDDSSKFYLYRHCDGYPDITGRHLKRTLANNAYSQFDGAKLASDLIQYNETLKYTNTVYYPYELTYCIHGDIEYLYVIDLKENSLKCYLVNGCDQKEENIVKPENEREIPDVQ